MLAKNNKLEICNKPTNRAHFEEVATQIKITPTQQLRFKKKVLIYTDGSKQPNGNLGSAWYNEQSKTQQCYRPVNHTGQLNTVLRSERIAILMALKHNNDDNITPGRQPNVYIPHQHRSK